MNAFPNRSQATRLLFDENSFSVYPADGRILSVPLALSRFGPAVSPSRAREQRQRCSERCHEADYRVAARHSSPSSRRS